MADAGKLGLHIVWDGQTVQQVNITSTRPQAFRLLNGQTPEQAVQMARLLFNVCGNAQGAAAAAAIAAAQGRELPNQAVLERSIACEAMQEHLWRLLLDWPKLLGLPPAQADFVRWHGNLRSIATGQHDMCVLRAEIETRWLGMSAKEWLELASLDELQDWWRTTDSPAALLLATLASLDEKVEQDNSVALLPGWTAAQVLQACGAQLNADFAAQPCWSGVAAETGALGYYAQMPLLQDALDKRPSRQLARVVARVCDTLNLVGELNCGRLDATPTADGGGLAVVRTARGLLLHWVQLKAGRVQDYLTVAPTEWNFHPHGALAAGLQDMSAENKDKLMQQAESCVLSLDPCVEYEMMVSTLSYA